jgi:HemY protein
LLPDRLTQRVATLMARIEAGESGEKGRVREWLARGVNAARDPVWMADGAISDHWEPTSPVDGRLDAFQWRVPVETRDATRNEILARRLEELIAIEAPAEPDVETGRSTEPVDAAPRQGPHKPIDADVIEAEPVTTRTTNGAVRSGARASPSEDTPISPATGPASAKRGDAADERARKPAKDELRPFVAPRPPDDPGTEPQPSEQELPMAGRNVRAVN